MSQKRRKSEIKVLSLIPELSVQESWSVERIPESGPRNPVLLQLLVPLGWPPFLTSLGLSFCLFQEEHTDPAGHIQSLGPESSLGLGEHSVVRRRCSWGQKLGILWDAPPGPKTLQHYPVAVAQTTTVATHCCSRRVTAQKTDRAGNM